MNDQPLPHPTHLMQLLQTQAHITADVFCLNLPRLADLGLLSGAPLKTSFEFTSEAGSQYPLIKLTIIGQLSLKCQRCMGAMEWQISHITELIAITDATQTDTLPDTRESVICKDGYVDFQQLVEDELLLIFPQVPVHSNIDNCDSHIHQYLNTKKSDNREENPFSILKELTHKQE